MQKHRYPPSYVAMASQKPDTGQPPIETARLTSGEQINFEAVRKLSDLDEHVREYAKSVMGLTGSIVPLAGDTGSIVTSPSEAAEVIPLELQRPEQVTSAGAAAASAGTLEMATATGATLLPFTKKEEAAVLQVTKLQQGKSAPRYSRSPRLDLRSDISSEGEESPSKKESGDGQKSYKELQNTIF